MTTFLAILVFIILVGAVIFFVFRKAVGIVWWVLGGIVLVLIILAISGSALSVFDEVSLPFTLPPLMREVFGVFGRTMGDALEVVTYPFRRR